MAGLIRELSPTVARYEMNLSDQQARIAMEAEGLHVFDESWTQFHSATYRMTTLKIHGSDEQIQIPMQICTKVIDLREALARKTFVDVDKITIIRKSGSYYQKAMDGAEVPYVAIVKGLASFKPQRYKYEHPTAIIGAGYNAIKQALVYVADKDYNFTMFDKYDRVGGTAWLIQANKTSKLQTDMAAFHIWFGPEWGMNPKRPETWLDFPTDWSTWPKKDEILAHMQHAAERCGILPHIKFETTITSLDIIEDPKKKNWTDIDRYYTMIAEPKGKGAPFTFTSSAVYHYPGAYHLPRQITYPGEQTFGGEMGFGMADDIPYYHIPGNRVAVLGNGAFGVENIRTACEYGAEMVYMVTRRRNMPAPRMVVWFAHQAIAPVPAGMIITMMEPFFKAARDFMDPWTSHQTYADKARKNVTISSNSRFGIGDVTFLALAWGRCEYHQDVVKRMSHKTLHLSEGTVLSNVSVVIKALGLLADFAADKLHKVKQLVCIWPNGDSKRFVYADALGMHAANFSSFSTGSGTYYNSKCAKYYIDFPREFRKLTESSVWEMLPRSVGDDNKPNFQTTARHVTNATFLLESVVNTAGTHCYDVNDYMHLVVNASHPLDRTWEECVNGWNQYQEEWWAQGFKHDYVPYPISRQDVDNWYKEYEENVGPNSVEDKEDWYKRHMDEKMLQRFEEYADNRSASLDSRGWWKDYDKDIKKKMSK